MLPAVSQVPIASPAVRGASEDAVLAARRFATACAVGALPALAVAGWFVNLGRSNFLQSARFTGNFYDLQARALFDGHWYVPNGSLSFEGIVRDGHTYGYYGPLPALLRMPILAVTHSLDGRLTQVSLLVAFGVALFGASRLLWRARNTLRPDTDIGRGEWWLITGWVFTMGLGTALLFPTSAAIVYHEAELWGCALALVGLDLVIGVARRPTRRGIVLASAVASAALLARASVGLAPSVALAIVAVVRVVRPDDRLDHEVDGWRARLRPALPIALAAAVPVALYVAVNLAKFGTLFSVPLDQQVASTFDRNRRAALQANGGSLFNVEYLASTLVQYFRPDAIRGWHLFPFLDFPAGRPDVLLGVRFDKLDRSSSVVATMPGLVVLAVVTAVATLRRWIDRDALRGVLPAVIASAVAVLPTLTIGFIANRYLIDFLPLLLVPASYGAYLALHALTHDGPRRPARRAAAIALVGLLGFGVWANTALAFTYQRLYGAPTNAVRRGFIGFQESMADVLPTAGWSIEHRAHLPAPGGDRLVVIGDCDALYWPNGTSSWEALEVGPGGAHAQAELDARALPEDGARLLEIGTGDLPAALLVRPAGDGKYSFYLANVGTKSSPTFGPSVRLRNNHRYELDAVFDRELRTIRVNLDGHEVYAANDVDIPEGRAVVVEGSGVHAQTVATPLCDRFTD
jgi:hypothetical protein